VAHAAYLVNLAAADLTLRRRSRAALAAELRRAARLGLAALVVHPGAAGGRDAATALELAAASLRWVCAATRGCPTRLLLENTAGQGTLLGGPLAHLEVLRRGLTRRVGVCLDTCHAFAAGHAIHEQAGYAEFLAEAGERFGWAALGCLHLNDSLHPFASRRDRHAHIGDGHIGLPTFARLLHDPRLAGVPMIVETETGPDLSGHRRDLETLRRLAAGEPC
jgi:deoxyribonuclease-4